MTVKEYITGKFKGAGITLNDSAFSDIDRRVDLNAPDNDENVIEAYRQLAKFVIPFWLLNPDYVRENGFDIGKTKDLEKFYLWLCAMAEIEPVFGSSIIDVTEIW